MITKHSVSYFRKKKTFKTYKIMDLAYRRETFDNIKTGVHSIFGSSFIFRVWLPNAF